jgi:hypothetical protein
MSYKLWTTEEEQILESNLGAMSFRDVGKKLGRGPESCRSHAMAMGLNNKGFVPRKYSHDHSVWNEQTVESCYWAGFLAADGCVQKRNKTWTLSLELARKDRSQVEAFRSFIGSDVQIFDDERISKTSRMAVHFGEEWSNLMEGFLVTPNKTKRLRPPEFESELLELSYLIGYLDGDGCICLVNRRGKLELTIRFVSSSFEVLDWIKSIRERLFNQKLKNKTSKIAKYGNSYSYAIAGKTAIDMFNHLRNLRTPKLARKWEDEKIVNFCSHWRKELCKPL